MIVNYMTASSTKRATNPPSKTLFIGNLAFEMTDADLNTLFREIKNVIDVRVAIDRRTGQPRGFAHADFVDVKSAVAGMEQLQGKEVYSRPLRVDYSASQTRSAFPARGQGRGEERGERGGDRGARY
jgi:RNA recognition motif-containing protein